MQRISSRATFFYKRVFPVLWIGLLLLFIAIPLLFSSQPPPLVFFVVPAIMTGLGFVLLRRLTFDLADEVADLGDALLVRSGGKEQKIPLSEIANVNYTPLMNPPRVTLSLRKPGPFGNKISFCAPLRFIPFWTSPVIDGLVQRVDAARRGA